MVRPAKTAPVNKQAQLSQYKGDGQFWTSEANGEAQINYAEAGPASQKMTPAMTMIDAFEKCAKKHKNKVAMRTENLNVMPSKGEPIPAPLPLESWKKWTWAEYRRDVRLLARAFMKLGVESRDTVSIFGFNSPEWLISEVAAMYAGGAASGIYPSDTEDQVQYKSFHSDTSVALVDGEAGLAKFKAVSDDLPYLKAVITWGCSPGDDFVRSDGSTIKTLSFKEALELGATVEESELDERVKGIKPGQCCALIYTSGTTGRPKAVMISHDSMTFEAQVAGRLIKLDKPGLGEIKILSYLPMSHIAGMLFDVISPIVLGSMFSNWASTNFARSYDLKLGTIGARLTTVQPTVFLGVPRVWEKIAAKLKAVGAATKGLKKKLSTTAKKKGLFHQNNMQLGGTGKKPSMYGVYGVLLKVIKKKLGLDKCIFHFSGAAPMTFDMLQYFGSLGINVNEAYGMSETTGAATFSTDAAHQWGTVGFEMPGVEVRCFKVAEDGSKTECPKSKNIMRATEEEQGEICFRGRNIMMGYLANPKLGEEHMAEIAKKNSDAIDSQGWLHSGDKGAISTRGMVRITGRYKELIIGAGGENIAPVPIEDEMKKLCPFVSNAVMIGDKRKFNVMLITLKCEGATGDLPGTDKLEAEARQFGKTIDEATKDPKLIAAISKALKDIAANQAVTPSNAAKVQKFTILPIDFSVQTDELTATLKLKRSVVDDKNKAAIDAMFESDEVFVPYAGPKPSKAAVAAEDEAPAGSFKMDANIVDDDAVATANKALEAEMESEDPAQVEAEA